MKKKLDGCEKLWAPWRMKYIDGVDGTHDDGCIFCDKPATDEDKDNFIVFRGETCFVIMNIFPYNNGHLMVVPYSHVSSIEELGQEERLELMNVIDIAICAIKKIMRPDGFNVGMNLGRPAGAGIDDHIHMHIVPRWNGDTNFMPIIGSAKVICESLEDTYKKITGAICEVVSEK